MNPKEAMLDLLTALKAVYLSHWAAHWRVKGSTSYGDHLLFERLYTAMPEQIDTLAEKIVAMHGPEALVDGEDTAAVAESLRVFDSEPNLYKRALMLEDSLQNLIQSVMSDLEDAEELTPGLDDYLAALANTHETHQYLLKQRLRPSEVVAAKFAARKAVMEKDRWFPVANIRVDLFGDDFTDKGRGLSNLFLRMSKYFKSMTLRPGWEMDLKDSKGYGIGKITIK